MNAKKVVSFLLLRPAFTGRNVTSLGLVAVFFAVYVAAGGKVTTVPKMNAGASFGSVDAPPPPGVETAPAGTPKTSGQTVSTRIDSIFSGPEKQPAPTGSATADSRGADTGDSEDGLDAIEARLKGLGANRGAN